MNRNGEKKEDDKPEEDIDKEEEEYYKKFREAMMKKVVIMNRGYHIEWRRGEEGSEGNSGTTSKEFTWLYRISMFNDLIWWLARWLCWRIHGWWYRDVCFGATSKETSKEDSRSEMFR